MKALCCLVGAMAIMARSANPLFPRLVLAIIVLGQVTVAPIIGFSLTYLLSIKNEGDQLSFDIDLAALDWIIIAGLMYGSLSLILALIAGAYSPASVVDRGGWLTVLGLRRNVNTPELIDRARLNLQRSPYGKMARLVSSKTDTYDLFSIHGGLQILAIPIQVALIAIPLLIMEGIPESYVEPERAFELGMVGYFIALWFGLRIQPLYSTHLIGIAAWFRNILAKISKFSWILPIVIFWVIARVMLQFSLDRLDVDYQAWHNVQLEAVLMKSIQLPRGLANSIERKLQAEQDAMRMEFVLSQEKQEAERKIISAQGERDAQIIISEGLTDKETLLAPIIRLYLESRHIDTLHSCCLLYTSDAADE